MKITFGMFFMLFFFCWTVQAQNQSGTNSNVVEDNKWITENFVIDCPTTGPIVLTVVSHGVVIRFNDGSGTKIWNTKGEGVDSNGGKWIFNEIYRSKYDPFSQGISIIQMMGPNGAKLTLKGIFIVNGNGEFVRQYFEPLCDDN